MNIAIINADSIFWEADKNIRLVDFRYIFEQIYEIQKPDQIYLIGGFEQKDPFNEALKEIMQQNADRPIISVPSVNPLDGHHNPEAALIDLLYRGTLAQESPMSTTFTIVSANASSIRPARYLEKRGLIEPVAFILADTLENFSTAAQLADIRESISLRPESRTATDNIAIEQILKLVKNNTEKENPFYNTVSVLIGKCKSYFSMSPMDTRLITLSLIHHKYLDRKKFINKAGEQRIGLVLGEKATELLEQFEQKENVEKD